MEKYGNTNAPHLLPPPPPPPPPLSSPLSLPARRYANDQFDTYLSLTSSVCDFVDTSHHGQVHKYKVLEKCVY